jgi:homoserine dehydrogenase
MFYGRGAGKFPTASAVVADIIDIVDHMGVPRKNGTYHWQRQP